MDKYYTPELNEFFIGFEYEEFHDSVRYKIIDDELKKWNKKIFNSNSNIYYTNVNKKVCYLEDDSFKDKFRVKLLDKEDIESLGWKHIGGKLLSSAEQIFSKGIYNLYYTFNKSLKIINDDENWSHEVEGGVKFEGNIKNKSELVKLLKQLNIG